MVDTSWDTRSDSSPQQDVADMTAYMMYATGDQAMSYVDWVRAGKPEKIDAFNEPPDVLMKRIHEFLTYAHVRLRAMQLKSEDSLKKSCGELALHIEQFCRDWE